MSQEAGPITADRDDSRLLRAVVETAVDGVILIDSRGTVLLFNPACERLFGYAADEVIGRNVKMLMPSPFRDEHDQYLGNYTSTGHKKIIGIGREVEGLRKDGTTFPLHLSVGEARDNGNSTFVGIMHDLSQLHETQRRVRELTAELLHTSRLTAMGQLSSSLAHELNQPLTAVANYTEAARQILSTGGAPIPPRILDFLDKANAQAQRAGQIIRRLRSFVEKGAIERVPEALNKIVEEATALATIGARVDGIRVLLDLSPDLPPVPMDKVQIQQVVVNLVRNAVEVLGQVKRRVLTIRTAAAQDGSQEVAVIDTGPGIDPTVADRLFTPFATTKADGMGIGLSISQSIVAAHGGRIWAEANPDGGAVFRFTLPGAQTG